MEEELNNPGKLALESAELKILANGKSVVPGAERTIEEDNAILKAVANSGLPNQDRFEYKDEYDEGILPGMDQQEYRNRNQTAWQMWRNSLTQAVGGVVADVGKSLAYSADVRNWEGFITEGELQFSNFFTEKMDEAKSSIQDFAPVNQTKEGQTEFAPGDSTWWAGNIPSIFSALSFLIPTAGAVRAAGALGKIAGAGTKFLTTKSGQILAKGITGAVFSRYNESMFEAGDVYNRIIKEGGTPEEAAKGASDSWNANMLAIGPDLFQYTVLAGGFKSLSKLAKFGGSMAGEGAEEAYQGIVGDEAVGSGLGKFDFFGANFNTRLGEYITDPHIQTAAFFGAIGGGVFQAAGEGINKLYKPTNERLAEEHLAAQRAKELGDKEGVRKIADITFARMAFDHLIAGKIADFKEHLDILSKETDMDPEVRQRLERYKEDTDFIEEQADQLMGDKSIDQAVVPHILSTQLDYRQAAHLYGELKKKASGAISDVVQRGEMEGPLQRAKDLYHQLQAYDKLQKSTGLNFEGVWTQLNKAFIGEVESFSQNPENSNRSIYSQIVTASDKTIQDTYDKLIAQKHRLDILKEDIADLTSPEGLRKQAESKKKRDTHAAAAALVASENPNPAHLRSALAVIDNPELAKQIEARLEEVENKTKTDNKEKTKKVADEAKKKEKSKKTKEVKQPQKDEGFADEPPPVDITDEPPSFDDFSTSLSGETIDAVFGAAESPADIIPGLEEDNIPEGTNAEGGKLTSETEVNDEGVIVLKRIKDEQPVEEAPPLEETKGEKEEQEAPVTAIEGRGAKTVLKEIAGEYIKDKSGNEVFVVKQNADGTPQMEIYYETHDYQTKSNPLLAHEVFDSTDEILTVNTPNVAIGQEVILKVEEDWRTFKSKDPDLVVINVYAVDKEGKATGKPLTQIPANINARTKKPSKTATPQSRALRAAVLKTPNKQARTIITSKTLGDFINLRNPDGSKKENSIEVLEIDMVKDGEVWVERPTPHNPIFANVTPAGEIVIKNISIANQGINEDILKRLAESEQHATREEMRGAIGVMRMNPLGTYRFSMLNPRKITQEEITWLKENLASYLAEHRFADLKNMIHVISSDFNTNLNDHNDTNRLVSLGNDIAFKVPISRGKAKDHFWVKIGTSGRFGFNFAQFMRGENFNFQVVESNGNEIKMLQDSSTMSAEIVTAIRSSFDNILKNQFKNINANLLNTEGTFIDPMGKEYKNYYEYLKDSQSLSTDLPEGYSFFNSTIYLDPNINVKHKVKDETREIVPSTKKEVEQVILKEEEDLTFTPGREAEITEIDRAVGELEAETPENYDWTVHHYTDGSVVALVNEKNDHFNDLPVIKRFQKAGAKGYNSPKMQKVIADLEAIQAVIDKIEAKRKRPEASKTEEKKTKKKIDWDKLSDEADERYRLASLATAPFNVMSEREIEWMKEKFGDEYLSIAQGVDRVISLGGLEAFGYYHNAMIKLAQFAEEGTGYHEAFHFVMLTQYSHSQQEKILQAAAKKYGKKDRLQLEEALAEDFRAYMLANGNYQPKVIETKSLFQRILDYIRKALGFKSSIERLFKEVANFELTPETRTNIGLKRDLNEIEDINDLRHKLLPGFGLVNRQLSAINATTHRLLEKAMLDAGPEGAFDDFLEVPENLIKYLAEIKLEYIAMRSNVAAEMDEATEDMDKEYLLTLADRKRILDTIIDNWEDKEVGENTVEGYRSTVTRNLSNYGFTVKAKPKDKEVEDSEDLDTPTDEALDPEEQTEGDESSADDPNAKERIHGVSFFLNNPLKTLSAKVKRFLTTIPQYEKDENGRVKLGDDFKPIIVKTVFGTPKFIEFNKVYANLSTKIAGHKSMYKRLEELASQDPLIAAVKDKLDERLVKGQQSIDSLPAQFFTTFNRSAYKFITVINDHDGSVKIIATDRRSIENTIKEDWMDKAERAKFITISEEDGTAKPDIKKATILLETIKHNSAKKPITYEELRTLLEGTLQAIGITLPPQAWENIDKSNSKTTIVRKMLFGNPGPSMEAFLDKAVKGENPFEETGLINELTKRSKDYVDDLQAKTFINEKNNQVSAINLNTPITDLINQFTNPDEGISKVKRYLQDKFYNGNAFLNHLLDPKKADKVEVSVFSAFREGNKEAKEYEDTTVQDSFITRLSAFFNGSAKAPSGYISLGTLSDKLQQLFILLPKRQGHNAKAFLKDVLKNTISNERVRIKRIKNNLQGVDKDSNFRVNDIAAYKNSTKFRYIPEINDIPNIEKSLIDGELSPEELIAVEAQVDQVIDAYIAKEEESYHNKLIGLGLIEKTTTGYRVTDESSIPNSIAAGITNNLKEFFYNDFAWRLETSKVLHGDLGFYKDTATYFKRGYQLITPGLQGYINHKIKSAGKKTSHRRAITASTIKVNNTDYLTSLAQLIDPKVTKEMIEEGLKTGKSPNRAVDIAIRYRAVNKTDAQGWISVEAYRDILLSVGQWTNDHEFFYENAWKQGRSIGQAIFTKSEDERAYYRKKEAEILLQPLKPFYFGDRLIKLSDGSSMLLKEQYKESLTVLLPEWANKHTQYKELLAAMNRDNVDIISDAEAVKVGRYGVNEDLSQPLVVREVPASNLRFPFLVPEKSKEAILAGTQLEKLIVGNIQDDNNYTLPNGEPITGAELKAKYHETWAEIIKGDYEKFKALFNLDENLKVNSKSKLQFLKDLKSIIVEELANRSLPDNYLDALEIIKDKLDEPTFLVGLDFPALGKKYEGILTNLFKKKLIKQKLPGDSLINLADFGNTKPEVKFSSELNFIRNDKGKILEAEVGLPWKFVKGLAIKKGVNYDEKTRQIIWESLNETQKQGLQFILYRIPTQGKNSMLPVRASFILPASSGSVIMLPGEMTKQGGMDFDVDKSYLMKRTHKSGKIEATNENKLFDIHWSILTSTNHAEELLNPLDSAVHDEMINYLESRGVVSRESGTSPFSVATDLEMEKLAKYSKAMIGIFSKFSVGHATLQSIKEGVIVKVPIQIATENYTYSRLGGMKDDQGGLISDNHSALQNSALDAQKDPKLGYLNITTFNANVIAYMTDLGVNQKLALSFLNQPIMRELADTYFRNGDNSLDNAIKSVIDSHKGIEEVMNSKERQVIITAANLDSSLTTSIADNIAHQGQVLKDFEQYYYAAADMAKVNTALSTDTVRDMTSVASIQGFIDTVDYVQNNQSNVILPKEVFDLATSPVKRVAAFYNYAIKAATKFVSQFYPYDSQAFNDVREMIAKENLHRNGKLKSSVEIEQVNQAMTIYIFGENKVLNKTLDKYSPDYRSRWNYFDAKRSFKLYLDELKTKYPELEKNLFIQALRGEERERRGHVQMIGINNTHGNFNKTNLTNAWWDLITSKKADIRILGYDLIRFAIQTSGFKITPTGFIDIIPAQFWRDSGLAAYHESVVQSYVEGKAIDVPEASKVIVRHLFTKTKLVPSASVRIDEKGQVTSKLTDVKVIAGTTHITEFTATKNSGSLYNKNSEMKYARFARIYDKKGKRWRLYEKQQGTTLYKEIQPLGEFNKLVEFTTDGAMNSGHPFNANIAPAYYSGVVEYEVDTDYMAVYSAVGLEKGIASASHVLSRLKETIKDQSLLNIVDQLIKNQDKLEGVEVVVDPTLEAGAIGQYYPQSNAIYINHDLSLAEANHVILHEIIHAYTVGILRAPRTKAEINFVENANRLLNDFKNDSRFKGEYALTNTEELIAELASSPSFRAKIKKKPGFWQRVLRAIRKALGLPSTETDLHELVLNDMYKVLDEASDLNIVKRQGSAHAAFLKQINPVQKELNKIFKFIVSSLDKRAKRLHRTGQDFQQVKNQADALTKMENKHGLVAFVKSAIDEVKLISHEAEQAIDKADAKKLRSFKEKVNTYKVLDEVRKHLVTHKAEYNDLHRNGGHTLIESIDIIRGQLETLNTLIDEASVNLIAKWVQDNTSQNIELDEIKQHLTVADRDVSLLNRGLDAIVDSRDEVLRVIGKTVIDKKAEAYRKAENLLRTKWMKVNEDYEAWIKTQGINTNDMKARNLPILDEASFDDNSKGIRFADRMSDKGRAIMKLEKTHPLRAYYETVVGLYELSQRTIPKGMKPGLRIPSIGRSSLEAFTEERGISKFRVLKEGLKDTFKRRYDELDRQATDEAGRPVDFLPIRFVSKQDGKDGRLERKEVSLDVASTTFMFIEEMFNHDAMMEVVDELELAKDLLASRKVKETKGLPGFAGLLSSTQTAKLDDRNEPVTRAGIDSHSYKQAEQFIKQFVYGKMKNDEGTTLLGVDVAKLTDAVLKYTGLRMMVGNLNVAVSNVATGEVTMLKEAVGGRWFSLKDWKHGKKKFFLEVPAYAGEIGMRNIKSKFGLVFEWINPEDNPRGNLFLGKDTTRLKKVATWNNLNFLTKVGTLEMNGSLMLALMHKEKLTDTNGKEVDLYDAIDVSTGVPRIKEGYTYKGKEFTEQDFNNVRNKIIRVSQAINGIYNTIDSPAIKAQSWGRLVLLMRNWLRPGINARWKTKYYDERLGMTEEGYYVSALNFFSNMYGKDGILQGTINSMKAMIGVGLGSQDFLTAEEREKNSPEQNAEITALRRANFKKFLFEMYVIAVLSAVAAFGWDEEEEDSFVLYQLVRLKRELSTFFSPSEAWSTLRQPTVALDTFNRFFSSVEAMTIGVLTGESLEEYKQGPNKGEVKAWAQVQNQIPFWAQRNQFVDLDRKVDLIERGWK